MRRYDLLETRMLRRSLINQFLRVTNGATELVQSIVELRRLLGVLKSGVTRSDNVVGGLTKIIRSFPVIEVSERREALGGDILEKVAREGRIVIISAITDVVGQLESLANEWLDLVRKVLLTARVVEVVGLDLTEVVLFMNLMARR